MPSFTDDLFVRLINHRVSNERARREDYLTECFTWMLANDTGFRAAVFAADGPLYDGGHNEHVPGNTESLSIKTQEDHGKACGRPDITIKGSNGFLVLIESKVDAPFGAKQVRKYAKWAHANGGHVFALIPSRKIAGTSPVEQAGFIAIRAWEDIAATVKGLPEAEPALQSMRLAFHKLLIELDVAPLPHKRFSWVNPDGIHKQEQLKEICKVLRSTADTVAHDQALVEKCPPFYSGNDGVLPLVAGKPLISQQGKAPRPIMAQTVSLLSKTTHLCNFHVNVYFRNYAGTKTQSGPSVTATIGVAQVVPDGKWVKNPAEFLSKVIAAGGGATVEIHDVEARAPKLLADFRRRSEEVLKRVGRRLKAEPGFEQALLRTDHNEYIAGISLMPTDTMVGEEVDTQALQEKFRDVLTKLIIAFFEEDPHVPFALLVTETMAPNWDIAE